LVALRDAHSHCLASVDGLLDSFGASCLLHIRVVVDMEVPAQVLWA
jgi:hypothetical protein